MMEKTSICLKSTVLKGYVAEAEQLKAEAEAEINAKIKRDWTSNSNG